MSNPFYYFLNQLGNRIQNYGYLLANPSYASVRSGKGCAELYRLLNKNWFPKDKIQLVLDVGVNEGQFIKTSLALMPKVPVYAFEPNPGVIQRLQERDWGDMVSLFPIALGSQAETLTLNVSQFSPASSLLQNSNYLNSEFPETVTETTINVDVRRLDSILQEKGTLSTNLLLKIDVQGFELEVLKGAVSVFDQILVIVCEVNLAMLYEQQCTLDSILSFLEKHHYRLIDIGNPVRSRTTEEALYTDLAFIRQP